MSAAEPVSSQRVPWAKLAVLGLNAIVAVPTGFVFASGGRGLTWVKFGGCWLMIATFVAFVWSLLRVLRGVSWEWMRDRREWLALAAVPAGWSVLLLHEPSSFKIIMDEIMLLGTSMSLHLDKLVQVPMRGHDLQGAFVIVDGIVDKRPYFFPFLVSLAHDVTGYRPENAFVVNAVVALLLLLVTYVLGRTFSGRAAAIAGVLVWAGLPLLAQNATGGGFDLLNLLMIAVTLWLAHRFVMTRGSAELTALCFACVLLAQTRYESAIFGVLCAGLVLAIWRRERRVVLTWGATLVPLLLLPVPLVLGSFAANSATWELASRDSATPVSWANLVSNLGHARAFFFAHDRQQANSLLFSALGVIALVALAWRFLRREKGGEAEAVSPLAVVIFAAALAVHFGFLMCYFWGQFDDPVITRLSLPTHLLILLLLWLVFRAGKTASRVWQAIAVAAVVQIWSLSIPAMAEHRYTLLNVHAREVEWRREFMAQRPERNYLVVDPYSVVWLTHKISSTSPAQTRVQPEALKHHLRARSFNDVFVFQRFEVDAATGVLQLRPEFEIDDSFTLQPVAERRLQPYSVSRISRIVAAPVAEPAGR